MGPGDKETGYIVGQSNVRKLGLCLIGASILFIVIGMTMQNDIAEEKSNEESYLNNARANKQVLFRARRHEMRDSKQEEMKLVKLLNMLQQHFKRDRHERNQLTDMESELASTIDFHDKGLEDVLEHVAANHQVHTFLMNKLSVANQKFHDATKELISQYGQDIRREGIDAEGRLRTVTQTILDELTAEADEERRENTAEKELESEDHEWKKMAKDAKLKGNNEPSKDEKDVEIMLNKLYDLISTARAPATPEKMIKLGQQLLKRSSLVPVTATQKATHKKVLDTMRTVLERVNFARRVNKRTVADAKLGSMFFEFVDKQKMEWKKWAMVKDIRDTLEPQLQSWQAGTIGTAQMEMKVQTLINEDKLDPNWMAVGDSIIETGTKDHQKDEGLEPVFNKKLDKWHRPAAMKAAALVAAKVEKKRKGKSTFN